MLLTLDIVLEILLFTPFQAVVVTDLMPFHPVVTLDFRLLTADFVVLLMEFQALVRLLFTLFQALVVEDLMLFQTEDNGGKECSVVTI